MTLTWTPEHDAFLAEGVASDTPWVELAESFTIVFGVRMTSEQARGHWKLLRAAGRVNVDKTTADEFAKTATERAEESATVRNLRRDIATLTAERVELNRLVSFYDAARTEPIAPKPWTIKPKGSGHHGIVMAQMADWHLDEVVRPEEVFFLNAYNRDIAKMRMQRWVDKVVTLPRDYMNGIKIDGLVIPSTGDLFTGDIHAELKESNEDQLLASLLYWMDPMISALETLDREYDGEVEVDAVPGNHGRTTIKPVFKGRAHSNVEWLFWSVIRDRLADRGSRVRVNVSDSIDMNVPIYGRNHLVTHGDGFHGGTGISGAYAPLSLGSHRKGVRQAAAEMPMATMVMGHFHQTINIPGVIMGGSMKGYDEYAFGLNLRPEEARQAMWVTTPEKLQVLWMPVDLQVRKAEGW